MTRSYTYKIHTHTHDDEANVIEADRVDIVIRRYLSRCIIVQSATAAVHCTPLRFRERASRHGTTGIYGTAVTQTCLSAPLGDAEKPMYSKSSYSAILL